MLGELSGVAKIFIITGRTDMRKSFDGLMAIIRDTYQLDPYANALYLFCGRDSRKLKALHYDKDGFVLYQKRLDENGRFQWPRNASEARLLTRSLLKVGYEHIQYVFFSLDRSTSKVKNIRQYMLTVLYNAPATINQFYDAEVRHDMYWGKDIPDG